MIITKKAIPRRTVLRGIGASLALPLPDGRAVHGRSGEAQGVPPADAGREHRVPGVLVAGTEIAVFGTVGIFDGSLFYRPHK